MKFQKILTATAAVLLVTGAAQAQTAGSNVMSVGWFRVSPNSSSELLTVESVGGVHVGQQRPNTGASARSADTLGLSLAHFFTDNISGEFVAGLPPKHDVQGDASYSKYGKLGTVKQWSPALVARYHFFDAQTKFRPYVGLGMNYTWFSGETISNQNFVHSEFGPNATMTAKAKASWNPVFNIGANYTIDERWSLGLSVSYLPISTRATLTTSNAIINAQGAQGTVVSSTKLKLNPTVAFLNIGYRF